MLSVNTNTGAMVALQYLNKTNAQLDHDPERHQHRLESRVRARTTARPSPSPRTCAATSPAMRR